MGRHAVTCGESASYVMCEPDGCVSEALWMVFVVCSGSTALSIGAVGSICVVRAKFGVWGLQGCGLDDGLRVREVMRQ